MKYLKILGLSAVAAMAVMAFVGAGSASASSLCQEETSPCPSPYTGSVVAFSPEAVLTAGSFVENCESEAVGSVNGEGVGSLTELTFVNCSGECTEAEAVNLPYHAVVTATEEGDGTLDVTSGGSGNPGAELTGCTVFNVSCTYTSEDVTLDADGGNPALLLASAEPLTRTSGSGLCPEKGTWTAPYEVTTPSGSLFVE